MEMKMIKQALIPGVQHGDEAELSSQAIFRVQAKLDKGVCRGVEEQVKRAAFVAKDDGVQEVRQGEDAVKVGYGEEFGFACLDPSEFGGGLAFRAVAVSTGVVGVLECSAAIAFFQVAAQSLGTAGHDVPDDFLV